MSLVGVYDAEWRTRKINLMRILRSFIYQLKPHEELTKVSLPSELCHPFSMLELVAYRELQLYHILFEINKLEKPLDRFLLIIKWFLGMVRQETVEKKPFNPVIEETHLCWVNHKGNEEEKESITEFIGEQVSHHPPVSAFLVKNKVHEVSIQGEVTFSVKIGTNTASVVTGGPVTIQTNKDKYIMNKCMPNMMVNNVIWGDKYLMWEGPVSISCPESKYSADIELKEENHKNIIVGKIYEDKDVIYEISGLAGFDTYLINPANSEKTLLVDISTYKDNEIFYMPEEALDELSTLKIWEPVKDAIIKNDLDRADESKKVIEADQRIREAKKKRRGKNKRRNLLSPSVR